MSTELSNGVIIPEEYSDDWYDEMSINLRKLNDVIGSDSEKLNADGVYFLRMSSAALTDSGTGNFSDLNSSYKIKTGDLVLDSGRKLYRIVSVDSTNETFTVGNSLFKVTAESDLAPVAESGDYDDLTDLPAYGIIRFCSSAITDNSSVAFSAISSTDKIKVGDFLLDTNGKLYQISSVDTSNETVSVTTPLKQLAQDSDVVHNSGNEDVNGIKTFKDMIPIDGDYLGNESSTNERTNLCLRSNRDTPDLSGAYISRFRPNKNQGALSGSDNSFISISFLENETRYTRCFDFGLTDWDADGIPQTYYLTSPTSKGVLGTSSRKWQTFNGIEPSSLSLPSGNTADRVDISSYITLFDGTTNSYTPPANGWISISANNCTEIYVFIKNFWGVNNSKPTAGNISVMLPVIKDKVIGIRVTGGTLNFARFIPCQGNV